MGDAVQFRLVDAFADRPFSGNTAGVVLDADGLDEGQMVTLAREVNASETAFISGANDLHRPPRLRWFTPTQEVGFCGHATLAAAHAYAELAAPRARPQRSGAMEFESSAGRLSLNVEPGSDGAAPLWWLKMPPTDLKPATLNPMKACELLGLSADDLAPAAPLMRTRDEDIILLIQSWSRLVEARPNFHELGRWSERHNVRGWLVATRATLDNFADVASRFFAPAVGIDEDPVTGSVHGPLCALLVARGLVSLTHGRAALNCVQGRPGGRSGLVRALVESRGGACQVTIGGACHTTIVGELRRPAARELERV